MFIDILELTVKENRASINGLLMVPHAEGGKKESLVHYILANAQDSYIEDLWRVGRQKRNVRDENRGEVVMERKRKRNEKQNSRRVVRKVDCDGI